MLLCEIPPNFAGQGSMDADMSDARHVCFPLQRYENVALLKVPDTHRISLKHSPAEKQNLISSGTCCVLTWITEFMYYCR